MSESTCPPLNLIPDRQDKSVWDNMRRIQAWANSDCCDCNLTVSAGTASGAVQSLVFSNSNGVTFGLSGSTITASAAGGGGGGAAISALGSSQNAGTIVWSNSNNVSFGMNGSTITASASGAGADGVNRIAVPGTTAPLTATVVFSNSNGLAFGLDAGGLTMTGSYTQSTHAHTGNLSATGNTVSSSSATYNQTGVVFAASGGGLSAGVTNGMVLYSLSQSTHAHTGNISATGNTIATNSVSMTYDQSALVYAASGAGLSAGVSNGSVVYSLSQSTHSHVAQATTVSSVGSANSVGTVTSRYAMEDHQHAGLNTISVAGNTSGNTSAGAGSLVLAGGPNITLSGATAAGGMTLSISGGAGGGGGAFSAGISTAGNTAGTTGLVGSQILFVGVNNVSLSQSTNGNSATLSINVVDAGAGATVSLWPYFPYGLATSSVNQGVTSSTGGSSQTTASLYVAPFMVPNYLSFNEVEMAISVNNTVAGTGSVSQAHMLGIYTLNAGTALSLSTSYAFNIHYSQNSITSASLKYFWGTNSTSNSTGLSTTNMSSILTGPRNINLFSQNDSLTPGHYFIGYMHTYRSTGSGVMPTNTIFAISESQTTAMGVYFGSNTSHKPFERWMGIVSTTTNGTTTGYYPLPGSIHTSNITHTGGTSQWMWPFHLMYLD